MLRVTNDNNYVEIKRGRKWRVKMTTINAHEHAVAMAC